jgi:hypothetical protein
VTYEDLHAFALMSQHPHPRNQFWISTRVEESSGLGFLGSVADAVVCFLIVAAGQVLVHIVLHDYVPDLAWNLIEGGELASSADS